jgi:hypothetical protein
MREANAGVAISAAVSRNATLARKECTLFHLKNYDPGIFRVILMKSLETCQEKNVSMWEFIGGWSTRRGIPRRVFDFLSL